MRLALLLLTGGIVGGVLAPIDRGGAGLSAVPASLAPVSGTQPRKESVSLTVDGRPWTHVGLVKAPKRIIIDNGRFRLVWYVGLCEPAAFEADVKVAGAWVDATANCNGDWLYPAGPVKTLPTEVEVLRIDSGAVALRLRFGDHWIRPRQEGYPSWYPDQRYPFYRTVWLRAGEYGYYTQIVLEQKVLFPYPDIEHEVGFGALWGPALVRTASTAYRTDTLSATVFSNMSRVADAAAFTRDGDPVARVLVPLSGAPMITPVFKSSYGGVYVYSLGPTAKYGAYIYAAPSAEAQSARAVCQFAWRNAPFALLPVTKEALEACGPGTP